MIENDEISVCKGTVLFRQGDLSDTMFVVASGRVRLTLGSGAEVGEVAVLGPGEFFGEISLLTGDTRSAMAEAVEDSRLLVVARDAFDMLVQDDLATVTRMLSEQGARLARTNAPLQGGLQRLARVRVIARGLREVGAAMRVPVSIPLAALAAVFKVPPEALSPIVIELSAGGAGTYETGTWTIASHAHVDALIAALVVHAG